MTTHNRNPLIAMLALSTALAAPAVFAQDATATQQAPTTDASAQQQPTDAKQAPTTDPAPATGAATQGASQTDASGSKQGWEDVDTNQDGNISKEEAAANPGLSQVFGQADTNADGSLTKDEYKAFVSKNYSDSPTK